MTTTQADKSARPRIYCIPAREAPVVLVFRRGPSDWFHLMRWDTKAGVLDPGVWVKKHLYPRRCDLSDDGELMLFYLSGGIDGEYRVFAGVSRTPWLAPLASWEEVGTWGRGYRFAPSDATPSDATPAEETKFVWLPNGWVTLHHRSPLQFDLERRRGWREAPGCEPQMDTWDEQRRVVLQKPSPTGGGVLRLLGGDRTWEGAVEGRAPRFDLETETSPPLSMPEVAWADWDADGRLLSATRDGLLQISEVSHSELRTVETHDIRALRPDPQPAPAWAAHPDHNRG